MKVDMAQPERKHRGTTSCVALKALVAAAAVCAIVVTIQYQLRPRLMLGNQVTLHLSKSVFINCLSNPVEEVRIVAVGLSGMRVTAVTSRLDKAFAVPTWATGCAAVGIIPGTTAARNYFIPFSAVGAIHHGGHSVWSNPIAA